MSIAAATNDPLNPERLWTREDVLAKPCPVPDAPGVYAWYFRELPSDAIDAGACHHAHGLPLLYVGISPKRPSASGATGASRACGSGSRITTAAMPRARRSD